MNAENLPDGMVFKVAMNYNKNGGVQAYESGIITGIDTSRGELFYYVVMSDGRELLMLPETPLFSSHSLKDKIDQGLTKDQIEELCWDFNTDLSNVNGNSKQRLTVALVEQAERNGQRTELYLAACKKNRGMTR